MIAGEGSFSTLGILGAMDKDVRRKCGKVRRALFHLLLIVGGKFLGEGEGRATRSRGDEVIRRTFVERVT